MTDDILYTRTFINDLVGLESPSAPVPITNEMDFIRQQARNPLYPGYSITRMPISSPFSPWATGTWAVSNYSEVGPFPVAQFNTSTEYAYTGVASGILTQPLVSGQVMKVFSVTDQAYEQVTLTIVGKTWICTNVNAGSKLAVVYDSNGAILSTSECYPKWFDTNWQSWSYQITDQEYFEFVSPVLYDGTWRSNLTVNYITNPAQPQLYGSFSNGRWTARLIQEPGDTFRAKTPGFNGLVKSYKVPISDPAYNIIANRTYLYDQALAIMASLAYDDTNFTDYLVQGLINAQSTDSPYAGMWYFSVDAYTNSPPDPYFRVGAHMYCIGALCLYIKVRGMGAAYASAAVTSISAGITAAAPFQQSSGPQSGLFQLGWGSYVNDIFLPMDMNPVVHQASSEHNQDAAMFLQNASIIVPGMGYDTLATNCKNAVAGTLWNHAIYEVPTFTQGISPTGIYDTALPLDVNTLGSLFWLANSNPTNALHAINAQSGFYHQIGLAKGYAPYEAVFEYPGALPNVWGEGSSYGALSHYRYAPSDTAAFNRVMRGILPLKGSDGGWQYCVVNDPIEELSTWEAISSTAMAIIVTLTPIRDLFYNYIS